MSYNKFFDIIIRKENFDEDIKQLIARIRPKWNLDQLAVKRQTGGLTNVLYAVWNKEEAPVKIVRGETDVLLIRLYGEMLIDRCVEMDNMFELSKHKLSANVWAQFSNGCCYQFIHGDVLNAEIVRHDTDINSLIIRQFAELHTTDVHTNRPKTPFIFNKAFEFANRLPDNLKDPVRNKKYHEMLPSKDGFIQEIMFLQKEVERLNCPVAFCHNDLIMLNVILSCDKSRVHFIDFEYSEYNYVPFDIGNHFNEFAGIDPIDYSKYPDKQFQLSWIREYLTVYYQLKSSKSNGHNIAAEDSHNEVGDSYRNQVKEINNDEVERWYEMINKCALVSHVFFIVWGIWQELNANIEFDYLDYSILRWNEYMKRKSLLFQSCN